MNSLNHRARQILDLEIEHLILTEVDLLARIAGLECDNRTLRELLSVSLAALADLTQRYDRRGKRLVDLSAEVGATRAAAQKVLAA
ncbi:MAG: hypothetical protein ABI818_10320 [Acidobacteriota bacterium]